MKELIQNYLKIIDKGILWNLISMVVSFVSGLVTGYLFYRLGKKEKIIIYYIDSQVVYSKKMSFFKGLELSYNGNPVSDFVVSSIEIMNAGTDEIEENDFAQKSPLRLTTTGSILKVGSTDSNLVESSNPFANISINRMDAQNVIIHYDYFGVGDRLSLSVMHSGKINVEGVLKAGMRKRSDVPVNQYKYARRLKAEMMGFLIFFPLIIAICSIAEKVDIRLAIGIFALWGAIFLFIEYRIVNIPTAERLP